jgi:hypothetical protein
MGDWNIGTMKSCKGRRQNTVDKIQHVIERPLAAAIAGTPRRGKETMKTPENTIRVDPV